MMGPGITGMMAPIKPIKSKRIAKTERKISIGQNYIIYLSVTKSKFVLMSFIRTPLIRTSIGDKSQYDRSL